MKKLYNMLLSLLFLTGVTGCGDAFLETDYYKGTDLENSLTSVDKIATALNGNYYNLYYYYFAGNYAINIGDIPTDISYWNTKRQHFNNIYKYTVVDTDIYLESIWEFGYKVVDNSSRIIEAAQKLYETVGDEEKTALDLYMAEAYALRGYAQLLLVNVFAHQVKVASQDFSDQPGIVVIEKPIQPYEKVSRSTVGKSYEAILNDLKEALICFEKSGGDRGSLNYFNTASVNGLLARTNLYLEKWDEAIGYAKTALQEKGITNLTYGNAAYKALYNSETSNTESMFALAITQTGNWSANSSGTLWSTYGYTPSPKLQQMYSEQDCRTSIFTWMQDNSGTKYFGGGKFSHFSSNNPAYGTHYIVNAPEMFLIIAEGNLMSENGTLEDARQALLTVAKRDAAITSLENLPDTKKDVLAFIKNERARELFQEGLRLYDLRRWGDEVDVYAKSPSEVAFQYNDYQISNLVYPIPNSEVTAGFGVEQNENWSNTLPER